MKRISMLFLVIALVLSAALAEGGLVPDSVITQAVMTETWNTSEFWWTETHVVLGERDLGQTIEVYVVGQTAGYAMTKEGIYLERAGTRVPMTVVVQKDTMAIQQIITPVDGEGYAASVRAMMPADCAERALRIGLDDTSYQTAAKAEAHLQEMGVTAPVMSYRQYYAALGMESVYQGDNAFYVDGPSAAYVQSSAPGNRVNLRTRPSKSAYSLGKVYTGAPVIVLDEGENGYVHVRIGYLEGYMDGTYLYDDMAGRESELIASRVTDKTGYATVYKWNENDAEIIEVLPAGEEILVLAVDDTRSYILFHGSRYGFVDNASIYPAP